MRRLLWAVVVVLTLVVGCLGRTLTGVKVRLLLTDAPDALNAVSL